MTVQQMIIEVYENSVENTKLFPYQAGTTTFDITTSGAVKCLGYLNRAYEYICSWKEKTGRRLRFEELKKTVFFQTTLVEGTAQAGTSGTITLASGESAVDDNYNGYVIRLDGGTGSGQIRVITDYDGATLAATVNRAWDTTPDATSTYEIYKNFYSLSDMGISPNERVYGILKIHDMYLKQELFYGGRVDDYVDYLESYQRPTEYIFVRNQVIFNYPFNEVRWFKAEYYALPDELASADESPVIPEPFHQAMIWYANYLDASKYRDSDTASEMFNKCVACLRTSIVDDDVMEDRLSGNFYVHEGYDNFRGRY